MFKKENPLVMVITILVAVVLLSFSNTLEHKQDLSEPHIVTNKCVLIPGGEFLMGSDNTDGDNPIHKVYVDSFYMDKYEVTNAHYLRFCQETGRDFPEFWGQDTYHCSENFPNHPVIGVNWEDAKAYADWIGKRLPTEAEWEFASRGGLKDMDYPWGNSLTTAEANYSHPGNKGTVSVGSYKENGYGLFDMSGNVVEWISDFYDPNYYQRSPYKNPQGPEKGKFRVIRGGGWHSGPLCNKIFFRNALPPNWIDFNVGFRCVKDVAF